MIAPDAAQTLLSRLAVCSWSLQPNDPEQLVRQLKDIGLDRVQLDLDPLRDDPAVWGSAADLLADNGITVVSSLKPPANPIDAMLPKGTTTRVCQPSVSPPTLSTAPPHSARSNGRVPIST